MENTNPQGSALSVSDAAGQFLGMMDGEEAQAQPEPSEIIDEAIEHEEVQEDLHEDDYDEPEETTPTYRVKVGKEEVEVPLDELIKGYSRTSDYTKKTQEVAEQRKAVEAQQAKIEEAARLRDQYAQRLSIIEQMLQQPEPDLSQLKETDPIGYAVAVAEQTERQKQLAAVQAERARLAQKQQFDQQERLKMHLASEAAKLREAIPEWQDEVKGEIIKKEIREYAKSVGFTDQELAQVYDSRAVTALYKAAQYDKLMKGKIDATKRVSQAPKMLRPGTSNPESRQTEQSKKLKQQVRKSGKVKDAARLFESFL
jgi:hypothetical protein